MFIIAYIVGTSVFDELNDFLIIYVSLCLTKSFPNDKTIAQQVHQKLK